MNHGVVLQLVGAVEYAAPVVSPDHRELAVLKMIKDLRNVCEINLEQWFSTLRGWRPSFMGKKNLATIIEL